MSKTKTVLKNHNENNGKKSGTPLNLIKEKEIEIENKIKEAQIEADKEIVSAQEKAAKIKQEALDKAPIEAKQHFDKEIEKAYAEAKKIEDSIMPKTEAVKKNGLASFDEAVKNIMEIILPTS